MDGAAATMDPANQPTDSADSPAQRPPAGAARRPHDDAADAAAAPEINPRQVVEAILFATDVPLTAAKIASILGVGDAREVRAHIAALNEQYEQMGLSFRIDEIAGGYQMLTQPAYNAWLTRLLRTRDESRLSPAALETLAIVAYKQPVTRADIEAIRGVAAGDLLNRLRELNLVKIVGRAEDLGRPMLYGTTKRFLEVFGLASLEDLPQVEALRSGGSVAQPAPAPASTSARAVDAEQPSGDAAPRSQADDADAGDDAEEDRPRLKVVDDELDDTNENGDDAP